MDECGGMRTATLLVAIMILAPFAQAVESPYSGNRELIVQPNPNGELSNLTEDAFSIPANSTILLKYCSRLRLAIGLTPFKLKTSTLLLWPTVA